MEIRPATRSDLSAILDLIRQLADFEGLRDEVETDVEDLDQAFFGESPAAECLVAESTDSELIGYAIFFTTFSSFAGKRGIWLEDIYIKPEWRGKGIGKRLLKAVGEVAKTRGAGRYEWCVLDWNQRAIDFYRHIGSTVLPDWRICRMGSEQISRLKHR